MRIEQFDPIADAESLRACHQIYVATEACDTPDLPPTSYTVFEGAWAEGFGLNDPRETWLVFDDADEPIGCCILVFPARENPTLAYCDPRVTPQRRRAGVGSRLLEHCASRAREAGRARLQTYTRDGSAGAAFAHAKGATPGIDHVTRIMDVGATDAATLSALRADAQRHASGYETLSWLAPTPAEYIDQVAELNGLFADAPQDDGIETLSWDADRISSMEQVLLDKGVRMHTVVARHADSGQLVALTQVAVDPDTAGWAYQQLTAVRREHRGHRLGLLVKVSMLDRLGELEPDVKHIFTGNAGANDHMIAINEQLGYRVVAGSRSWELDVAARP